MPLQSGDEAMAEKWRLENEIKRCIARVECAEKLTSGLEEEKVQVLCPAPIILIGRTAKTGQRVHPASSRLSDMFSSWSSNASDLMIIRAPCRVCSNSRFQSNSEW